MDFKPLLSFKLIFVYLSSCSLCSGQYYNNYYGNYNPYYQQQQPFQYQKPIGIQQVQQSNLQCAKLWDGRDYNGRTWDFNPSDKKSNLQSYYFTPQAVQVKPGCSLTIFDAYGTKLVLDKDESYLKTWNIQLDASCCDCNHCEGDSVMRELQCARLYEHESCNGCTGFRLDLKNGDRVKSFGMLDNRMSSLAIRPGCQLITYYKPGFDGWRYNFTRSVNLLGENWYKHISSAECFCYGIENLHQTYPYTKPQIALPTVPPNWYTLPTSFIPTVPTARPAITFPTVPTTTRPLITVTWFTVPSTTSRTTIEPTTTMDESIEFEGGWDNSEEETTEATTTIYSEEDDDFDQDEKSVWDKSEEEEIPTTTKRTTTTTTTEEPEIESEDDEDDDDGFFRGDSDEDTDKEVEDSTTTTTPKPTTTTIRSTTIRTTTTTEAEENKDWDDDW